MKTSPDKRTGSSRVTVRIAKWHNIDVFVPTVSSTLASKWGPEFAKARYPDAEVGEVVSVTPIFDEENSDGV